MPPQTVGFLGLFGLKTGGIHFAFFGLECMVFGELRQRMNAVFIVSVPNE